MPMKMTAKTGGGGNFEYPEPGVEMAMLVAIVDLGTVFRDGFGGQRGKDTRQIYLVWELVDQQMTGCTDNHLLGKVFTHSFDKKAALRGLVEAWIGRDFHDGEEFDLESLFGKPCQLNIKPVEGKAYVKLDDKSPIAPLHKSMKCPPAKHKPKTWYIEGSDKLPEHLGWLPWIFGESVCDRIRRSNEWKAKMAPTQAANDDEGEIPDNSEDPPF